ncbi:UxaA family hydrolase, partial [Rhizobiaceae sp. 2RAB30]
MARFIKLSHADNILLAVDPFANGEKAGDVVARARIPRGHKMALRDIAADEPIVKYGQTIGFARGPITAGDWVHEHNVYLRDFERDYGHGANARETPILPDDERATFMGYRRPSGKVGTRNYIATLTSVNCSASVARFIAEELNRSGILRDYPNVDGIISLVHGTG